MSLISTFWFDLVVIAVLVLGFKLGQRKEPIPQFLSIAHWILTLLICLFLYEAPAIWLAKKFSMQPDTIALILFPIEFLLVYFLLGFGRRRLAKKIVTKEAFGNWEIRVSKTAGALRFFIFLLAITGWIHGRYVTAQDIKDHQKFCEENFGGITFPVLSTINDDMFNGSYSGKFARKYLSAVMMTPIPRVDYGEPAPTAVSSRKRKVQLREVDLEFESAQGMNVGKNGKEQEERRVGESEAEVVDGANKTADGISSHRIIYRDITLRGISGSGERLFALINDQTFGAGELSSIKIDDRRIHVECVQILHDSVVVKVEGNPEPFELRLGVATNLKGEPVIKQ
ncbi:MAG: CvpA family protein [Limisphaerales bacterium]